MRRVVLLAALALTSLLPRAAEPTPPLTLDDEIAISRAVTLQVLPPPSQGEFKNAPQSLFLAYRSRKADAVFLAVRKTYPVFMPVRNKGSRPTNKQQCYYNPTNRLPELRVELSRVEVIETDVAAVEAISATCSNREVSATFFLKKVRGNWRINKIKQG